MTLGWSEAYSGVHRDAEVILESCSNFQMACGKLLETGESEALMGPTTIVLVLLRDLVEHWAASKLPGTCRWMSRDKRLVLKHLVGLGWSTAGWSIWECKLELWNQYPWHWCWSMALWRTR